MLLVQDLELYLNPQVFNKFDSWSSDVCPTPMGTKSNFGSEPSKGQSSTPTNLGKTRE